MKPFACPWCGRLIQTARAHVPSHLTPGGQRCIAVGVNAEQARKQRELMDAARAAKARK